METSPKIILASFVIIFFNGSSLFHFDDKFWKHFGQKVKIMGRCMWFFEEPSRRNTESNEEGSWDRRPSKMVSMEKEENDTSFLETCIFLLYQLMWWKHLRDLCRYGKTLHVLGGSTHKYSSEAQKGDSVLITCYFRGFLYPEGAVCYSFKGRQEEDTTVNKGKWRSYRKGRLPYLFMIKI